MTQVEELKQDKNKLIDEILDLVDVIEKKDKQIEHLKLKLELKDMKIEDQDIEGDLLERNS